MLLLHEHWHDVKAPMLATVETITKTLLILMILLWLRLLLLRLLIPLVLLHLGGRLRAAHPLILKNVWVLDVSRHIAIIFE